MEMFEGQASLCQHLARRMDHGFRATGIDRGIGQVKVFCKDGLLNVSGGAWPVFTRA